MFSVSWPTRFIVMEIITGQRIRKSASIAGILQCTPASEAAARLDSKHMRKTEAQSSGVSTFDGGDCLHTAHRSLCWDFLFY